MTDGTNNVCATCKDHCCRYPMMIQEELEAMAEELGVPIEQIPVIESNVKHLEYLGLKFYEMHNPVHCYAFEPGKGCKLPHEKKPVICKLYPWIPYNFEGGEWELLLDVDACPAWEFWGKTLKEATEEFRKIREKNPERWKTK